MNKPLTQNEMTAARRLTGRVSLITGSTSRIGLRIARALAAAGSALVLNAFGKPEEISATKARLAEEFDVTLVASPFKTAYVAAKHGIVGRTKVTALETAEHNITCNAICPGYVYTPLVEAQIDDQANAHNIPREQVIREVLLAQQPNKRFATVEELGALTVFLASDSAASITGITLPVDGGWTAH
jgi:NAD(P)-dependent dehydrogenase (short-subunit alcohol dehydrogenase family)